MHYTNLLKHSDAGCGIMKEYSVQGSQILEQIVPEFFNHPVGDGYPHVLIVCSDSKDSTWTDKEFQAKFQYEDDTLPEILSAGWICNKRAKRLCVHIDKNLCTIPNAVEEVMRAVSNCYKDAKSTQVGDFLEDLPSLFNNLDDNVVSHCNNILAKAIRRAHDEVGCNRTLFVRIILPKRCFDEFKDRPFPPFVEYVVLGQLQDPIIQDQQTKITDLQKQLQEKNEEISRLSKEMEALKSDFAKNKVVPESEVKNLILTYEDRIAKLTHEYDILRTKLDEIINILNRENSHTKIKRID